MYAVAISCSFKKIKL